MVEIGTDNHVHISISFTAAAQMQSLSKEGVRVERFGSCVVD